MPRYAWVQPLLPALFFFFFFSLTASGCESRQGQINYQSTWHLHHINVCFSSALHKKNMTYARVYVHSLLLNALEPEPTISGGHQAEQTDLDYCLLRIKIKEIQPHAFVNFCFFFFPVVPKFIPNPDLKTKDVWNGDLTTKQSIQLLYMEIPLIIRFKCSSAYFDFFWRNRSWIGQICFICAYPDIQKHNFSWQDTYSVFSASYMVYIPMFVLLTLLPTTIKWPNFLFFSFHPRTTPRELQTHPALKGHQALAVRQITVFAK